MNDQRDFHESSTGIPGLNSGYQDPYQRPDQAQIRVLLGRNPADPDQIQVRQSVRRQRGLVCLCVLAATIGGLLILFQSPMRNELLAPGPLTSHHAQILAGMGGDRCAACHTAGNDSWLGWTGLARSSQADCPTNETDLCLKCHQKTIPAQLAANPHSLNGSQLQQLTATQEAKFRLAGMQLPSKDRQRELTCATCHNEHHGAEIDLTAMTDQQCQTCHVQRHQSIEKGHPDFNLVGTQLPSTLQFDHDKHIKKYFPEADREFTCANCHVGDSQKNVMRLASFETMCASCHDQTIRNSGQQGLVLLELPMLDLDRLRSVGIEVGYWPKEAQGDFAGRFHPMTWALLYRNESLRETLQAFPADFDFSDIEVEDQEQLKKLGELVLGIKQLLVELGSQDISGVMGLASGSFPSGQTKNSELQFFRDSIAAWFPEMAAKGGLSAVPSGLPDSQRERHWLPHAQTVARWLQEEQQLLAPNPLAGKVYPNGTIQGAGSQGASLQAVPPLQPTAEAGPLQQVVNGATINNNQRKVDNNQGEGWANELPPLRDELATTEAKESPNSVQLAENPLKGLGHAGQSGVSNQATEVTGHDPSDSIDNLGPQRRPHAPPHKLAENQPTQAPAIEPVFSALSRNQLPQPTLLSGWRRDDRSFKLVYYVAEHSDSFWQNLQRWQSSLELVGHQAPAKLLRGWLSKPGTAGDCLSCHAPQVALATNRTEQEMPLEEWRSVMRLPERKTFTWFNHSPHLLQLKCSECHQLDVPSAEGAAKTKTHLAGWSQGEVATQSIGEGKSFSQSDFAPIGRVTCIQCHRQEQASSSCTTCHEYHVDQQWVETLEQLKKR